MFSFLGNKSLKDRSGNRLENTISREYLKATFNKPLSIAFNIGFDLEAEEECTSGSTSE